MAVQSLPRCLVLCALLAPFAIPGDALADWTVFEQTSIQKIAGKISKGHIFQTRSGSMYEVAEYIYLYEYQYGARVTVLRDGGSYRLIIDGIDEPILCRRLSGPPSPPTASKPAPIPPQTARTSASATPQSISSRIDGEFEGWDGETIFKLVNGQIWQQASYSYHYHYAYSPSVLIYAHEGRYYMKVDGVDDALPVTRLK